MNNNTILFFLCLSVVTTAIAIFMWISARKERNFFIKLERSTAEQLRNLRNSFLKDEKMSIITGDPTRTELLTLISNQNAMITNLHRLLKASQERNKAKIKQVKR